MRGLLWAGMVWGGWMGIVAQGASGAEAPVLQLDTGGHTAICRWVGFTPDGTRLVSAGDDKVVRVWDVSDLTQPRLERSLRFQIGPGPEGKIYAAAISPHPRAGGGLILAVGGYGTPGTQEHVGDIRLVDLDSGQVLGLLKGHTSGIAWLASSADGRFLASGSGDATVRVWDVGRATFGGGRLKGELAGEVLKGHTGAIYELTFVEEAGTTSLRLASASDDRTLRLWERKAAGSWTSTATLTGHTEDVKRVVCAPDGRLLASSSKDRSVRLWDARSGQFLRKLGEIGGDRAFDARIAFTPDGRNLVAAAGVQWDGSRVWRVADGTEVARFDGHDNSVFSVAVQPRHPRAERDGDLVASAGGRNNDIHLWNAATGKAVGHIVGTGRAVWAVAVHPDGRRVAFGNTGEGAELTASNPLERTFDLARLEAEPPQAGFDGAGFARAKLTQAGLSVASTAKNRLAIRRGDRELAAVERREDDQIICYTFVPGGDSAGRIAVGSAFGLTLHDVATGKQLHKLVGHTGIIWAVAVSPDGRWLVSGSQDQTFRIWNVQTGDLVLSVFAGSDDAWVAWTPEGYHAASPAGQRLIGWHVNRGADQAAEFFTAAQFKSLYRPDIVSRVLETGSVAEAVALADRERGKTTAVKTVDEALPPTVAITSPRTGTTSEKDTLTVSATATSRGAHPVTMLKLLVDGRPYEGKKGERPVDSPKLGDAQATWTVELSVGKHRLQALADSAVSQGKSDEVTVSYVGAAADPVQLPRLYVVAVGITAYPGDLRLNYAAQDAESFVTTIKAGGKPLFREIETKLLTDKQATRADVLKGLTWLRQQMTQNDFGIFYFSGHGQKDADGALYFLPVDVDTEDLLTSAVAGEQVKRTMTSIPGKLMLMLDACHAGGVDAVAPGKRRAGGSLTDDLVRDLITDENGLIVMCSSTGREFSLENNQHRHGNFTQALTEGLSGKADYNHDGSVYITELDLYVTERVKELSRGQQHPVTGKPASLRPFPLAKTKP